MPGLFVFEQMRCIATRESRAEGITMARITYGVGDVVVLRDSPLRTARSAAEYTILAILPDQNGAPQYRVRATGEGFDRRVSFNDIDIEHSAPSAAARPQGRQGAAGKEPWLKASSIKVHK